MEVLIEKINGEMLCNMIISGANNLSNQRMAVDNLNVFPVPDGDTGTNMSLTICSCIEELSENFGNGCGTAAKILASATLRGARGNSGVILSQLMRGFSKGIGTKKEIGKKEIAKALKCASETAYRAVMKPTEGTILTIARETSEAFEKISEQNDDLLEILRLTVEESRKSLARTQSILKQLKEAGVVDAGGKGLVCILEGALSFLEKGEVIEKQEQEGSESKQSFASVDADIKYIYCTEFLINKTKKDADVFKFKSTIEHYGDSMVVIDDDDIVKVHIHTNMPNLVLGEALILGQLTKIKIDNMKYQHTQVMKKEEMERALKNSEPEKENAFIAVAAGSGIIKTLYEIGVDKIIEGGQTMNPSTEDILKSIDSVNAKNIYVFPNNKNIILAAEQAKELSEKNVIVIPTKSIPQSVSAILAFDEDASCEENTEEMTEITEGVKTVQTTEAVRDTTIDGTEIKKGDILGIIDGKIKKTGKTDVEVLLECLDEMVDDESGIITVFCGEGSGDTQNLSDILSEKYDDCDISVYDGNQPVYTFIASVE